MGRLSRRTEALAVSVSGSAFRLCETCVQRGTVRPLITSVTGDAKPLPVVGAEPVRRPKGVAETWGESFRMRNVGTAVGFVAYVYSSPIT